MTLRVVFAGTPEFSVPCLRALLDRDFNVVAVLTQPDRPAGRGRLLRPSPVKQLAAQRGVSVYQPVTLKGQAPMLRSTGCNVMVVVAYGLLLPAEILTVPALGCINVHASLLPRWRGAAPIPRAIEAGDAVTGVTVMLMEQGLDTGPILSMRETPIKDDDTAKTIHDRLAQLGADLLMETLPRWENREIEPIPQDSTRATLAPKLNKHESSIDWNRSTLETRRKIKAFNPWPVVQTRLRGQRIRLWDAALGDNRVEHTPGTITHLGEAGISVQCGDGTLIITELQREGGVRLRAADFINGFPMEIGERFDGVYDQKRTR
jgi:methionyl-tRNA formyltransferase